MGRLVCALRVRSLGCRYVRLIEWLNGERNECNFELCSRERTQMHHLGPRHRDQHYVHTQASVGWLCNFLCRELSTSYYIPASSLVSSR